MATGTEGAMVLEAALPLDLRPRLSQRQGHQHQEPGRSDAEEAARRRVSGVGDPRGPRPSTAWSTTPWFTTSATTPTSSWKINPPTRCSKSSTAPSTSPRPGVRWRATTQKVLHAPLVIQPVNLMEKQHPAWNSTWRSPCRGADPTSKRRSSGRSWSTRPKSSRFCVDYGVPLVKCEQCIDLRRPAVARSLRSGRSRAGQRRGYRAKCAMQRMADLKKWLAQGANPDDELQMPSSPTTSTASATCSTHGAHVDARDGEGYTPLINATRFGFVDVATYLIDAQGRCEPAATAATGRR